MAGDGLGAGPEGATPDELVLRDICENNVEERPSNEVNCELHYQVNKILLLLLFWPIPGDLNYYRQCVSFLWC